MKEDNFNCFECGTEGPTYELRHTEGVEASFCVGCHETLMSEDFTWKWKITYFNVKKKVRVWYMQCGWDSYTDAVSENNRIINEELSRHEFHRTKTDLKIELFKAYPIAK